MDAFLCQEHYRYCCAAFGIGTQPLLKWFRYEKVECSNHKAMIDIFIIFFEIDYTYIQW